jgi:Holliday junction resolvase
MLTREQLLFLRLEAKGVRLLPIATRRSIAKKIEKSPEIDVMCLAEGSALVIEVKSTRQELEQDVKKLQRAEAMIVSDPDIMRGSLSIVARAFQYNS